MPEKQQPQQVKPGDPVVFVDVQGGRHAALALMVWVDGNIATREFPGLTVGFYGDEPGFIVRSARVPHRSKCAPDNDVFYWEPVAAVDPAAIASALRLEPGDEPGEWFIPAEPEPLGPFGIVEACQEWMAFMDRTDPNTTFIPATPDAPATPVHTPRGLPRGETVQIKRKAAAKKGGRARR